RGRFRRGVRLGLKPVNEASLARQGQPIDQFDHFPADFVVLQPQEPANEAVAAWTGEELGHRAVAGMPVRGNAGGALEKELDAHTQDAGDLKKAARPDAVSPFLVLLDLLEGEPKGVRQLFLAHSQEGPSGSHPASDMPVDGAG